MLNENDVNVRRVKAEAAPLDLLLTADPSIERVRQHLSRGTVFVGEEQGLSPVAAAVLEVEGSRAELLAIAVAAEQRGRGLGRTMLEHVIAHAVAAGVGRVEVGTGNSSLSQLAFYQKCGFRIVGVLPGFFDRDRPFIFENGIRCRDMIRLAIDVKEPAP